MTTVSPAKTKSARSSGMTTRSKDRNVEVEIVSSKTQQSENDVATGVEQLVSKEPAVVVAATQKPMEQQMEAMELVISGVPNNQVMTSFIINDVENCGESNEGSKNGRDSHEPTGGIKWM
ncbi:hypothetical protein PHYPSEUDO_004667 [Phytophthora pseudosyringae]|uniref:Uncharacterized protein n=1 Tax=Phytophthora pseudosyringae TaxID=221518 RepID=A0A8T1VP02_9STRA|nr:hypothetical protein PHYPSEUDO_004667 [Phytophthora pseudosyringae]